MRVIHPRHEDELKVSRNTVVHAYERLVSEGYLDSRVRSGIFVSETAPALRSAARPTAMAESRSGLRRYVQSGRHSRTLRPRTEAVSALSAGCSFVSTGHVEPPSRQGPEKHGSGSAALSRGGCAGFQVPWLYQEVWQLIWGLGRGVVCEWWQIAITSGSQQALHLLAQLLLKPGDAVWMEEPGYVGAVRAWKSADAAIKYLPVDANGMVVPPPEADSGPVSIVYVTPSRQFPTGASLSLARRLALVNGAKAEAAAGRDTGS